MTFTLRRSGREVLGSEKKGLQGWEMTELIIELRLRQQCGNGEAWT